MKNLQKGFTLVELIVVITILAILGTIAFISLQGYSQDAKNSKVTSDLRTVVSAIETGVTDGSVTLASVISTNASGSGLTSSGTTFGGGIAFGSGTYDKGIIDFAALRQNGADFKDPEGNDYLAAYISDGGDNTFYQIVGQTKTSAGEYIAVVKGNYIEIDAGDANGLIAEDATSGSGADAGIVNGQNLGTSGLYQ